MALPERALTLYSHWRAIFWLACGVLLTACEQPSQQADVPLVGLRVTDVLGADERGGFARAQQVIDFEFPRDHGPHPAFRSEWWYLTAALEDASGKRYGVQFTLFRQALTAQAVGESAWQSGQAYLAHLALTDVSVRQHYADQRFARQHPANAGVNLEPFRAYLADWQLVEQDTSNSSGWPLKLLASGRDQASDTEFAVALDIVSTRPPVLQGDQGLSHKGPGEASYYYSMPRLAVSGSLVLQGSRRTVTGLAWLDREWSTSVLSQGVIGWDWLALHLIDGRELMAFRLRRRDGERDPYDHGLLVEQGASTLLKPADYTLTPTRFWQDGSGGRWPVAWTLTLASGEQLMIEALVDDQLMRLGLVYWEGLVEVSDATAAHLGYGYLELTGYANEESETREP